MVRNTSTIQDTNGWCWKFRNNKQDSSIPIRNQFHKEVEKIASFFYIKNFPDCVDAKRLWVECQSYERIVDAFIANKRSKAGKRFGFVRFLGVKNKEQLVRSLASIWIGSYHLFTSVARFNRQEKNEVFSKNNEDKTTNSIPSQKIDHVGSSQNKKSYASSLNGDRDSKVKKQVTAVKGNTLSNVPLTLSLITLALVLDNSCVSVRDLSRHVMGRVKDLNSIPNLRTLLNKEGFLVVKLTYLGGMWVMIELDNEATKLKFFQHIGVNSWFHVLQAAIHNFVNDERVVWVDIEGADNTLEKFKVIFKGKVYMARAKELFTWTPIFLDHKESEYISNDESLHGEKNKSVGSQHGEDDLVDDSDVEGISETFLENDHRGVDLNTEIDKVNSPLVHMKVMNNSQKVHENVTSNGESAFNYSHNAHNGGLILEVLDDMIRVGQSIGYAMEGCMKDIEHIIGTQRVDADNISSFIARWNGETIVMGDFNKVRLIDERFSLMFNQSSSRLFNHFITSSRLVDAKLEGYTFTWAHPSATKMSKLDRFLVSKDYGPIPFCFYHYWFKWDRFDVMVEQAWNYFSYSDTNGLIRFKKKLQDLKKIIRSWIKDKKLQQSGAINSIKEDLIVIDKNLDSGNVSDEILLKRMELTRQLHDINQMEARDYLRIMVRISLLVQMGIHLNSLEDIRGSLALISIRLLNVSLKVGLFQREILANRLAMVILDLVSDIQSAFVANRQILDGPFILNELLAWCKRKKKKSMIFKVDFAKVYDSVHWDYLLDVLKAFGFGPNWCKWIRGTFSSAMASILVNGSPTSEFPFLWAKTRISFGSISIYSLYGVFTYFLF
nr:RNA-directed DNA polymerase, eukaryota, reverse transcriptase zinc-binding domain protein [Tanacetum cinerariifolium]